MHRHQRQLPERAARETARKAPVVLQCHYVSLA